MYDAYRMYPTPYYTNTPMYNPSLMRQYDAQYNSSNAAGSIVFKDYGPEPYVVNINEATKQNNTFRTALWTGNHLQLTLMSIPVGGEIGLEIHPNVDQFLRVEEGQGIAMMGKNQSNLNYRRNVYDDFAILIPAGTWHNVINTGDKPLKIYSIYAPPQHPHGTVHATKADAEAAEQNRGSCYQNEQSAPRQTREFTLSELAQYDGTMGKPAYVAVNGIVYDVSNNSKWSKGTHHGLTAGKDLSSQFGSCHGEESRLAKLPKVGILKG
jgi:predicted heme/steroid binding protein/mannose-6-phosphate isomerase-like protein (cupin superfamily)